MKKIIGLILMALLIFPALATAQDPAKALNEVFVNYPVGNDVPANAWVALPGYSSNNPAALRLPDGKVVSFFGSYAGIRFDGAPTYLTYNAGFSSKAPGGLMQLTFTNGDSKFGQVGNDPATKMEFTSSPSIDFQYTVLVPNGSVGFGYTYYKFDTKLQSLTGTPLGMIPVTLEENSRGHYFTFGGIYEPVKKLTLGATFRHMRDTTTSDSEKEESTSNLWRVGASYALVEDKTVSLKLAADYQGLNQHEGNLNQAYVGAEVCFYEAFCFNGGYAGDSPAAGFAFATNSGGVSVGYQHSISKNLEDTAFGRASYIGTQAWLYF